MNPMRKKFDGFQLHKPFWKLDEINVNTSRRQSKRSVSIEYIMREPYYVMSKSNQIDGCSILNMPECLTVREAILMIVQKNIHTIIIQSDSQFVVCTINDKISVL